MKTIKRSIALVLAMILTLAMSVTVFVHQTQIKTHSVLHLTKAVQRGQSYGAYQILSGDLSSR